MSVCTAYPLCNEISRFLYKDEAKHFYLKYVAIHLGSRTKVENVFQYTTRSRGIAEQIS